MKAQVTDDSTPPSLVIAALHELAASTTDQDVRLESCAELDRVVVKTRNSVYELTVLSGDTGEVMVRGGEFFPEVRRATVAGSIFGGSSVKLRTICVGLHLELRVNGKSFVTSRVEAVCHCRSRAMEGAA